MGQQPSQAEELLDVVDDEGRPIGQKPRFEVHRDHDRHGLVFVWSAWESDGRLLMLLQRRGRDGDPFIGRADALAGGHIGAGETPVSAARRELVEEVGLKIDSEALVHLGSGRRDSPVGECRRVFQHMLLLPQEVNPEKLSFTPEVDGFYLVDLREFDALILGQRKSVVASMRTRDGTEEVELRGDAVVDYPDAILDTFRRSVVAITEWLGTGLANPRHFE